LRVASDAVGRLDAAAQAVAREAATSGFHLAFATLAGFTFLGLLICLGMRDLPLQSSDPSRSGSVGH